MAKDETPTRDLGVSHSVLLQGSGDALFLVMELCPPFTTSRQAEPGLWRAACSPLRDLCTEELLT